MTNLALRIIATVFLSINAVYCWVKSVKTPKKTYDEVFSSSVIASIGLVGKVWTIIIIWNI